jgi:hypothetical protein
VINNNNFELTELTILHRFPRPIFVPTYSDRIPGGHFPYFFTFIATVQHLRDFGQINPHNNDRAVRDRKNSLR